MPIVTLTTDYGIRDHYVGVLKGVIAGIAPKATILDVTHEIAPHSIMHGAFVLWQCWQWYPRGTIHVVVVDPGVGSGRRIIAGRFAGQVAVAPDNGLLTLLHRDTPAEAMHVVSDPRYYLADRSATFHGRDILAPVAAHLALGVKLRDLGPATDRLEMLPIDHQAETGQTIRGSVLHVDRFGTLITNIGRSQLAAPRLQRRVFEVAVNGESVGPIRATFSEVPVGEAVALIGGCGLLEIAVNQGRAEARFGPPGSVSVEVQ